MYNYPYFIPNFTPRIAPAMLRNASATRGIGLFSKLGNSINTIKSLNWGGLINNTSKTLGIINQTIPLVKQVKPVMNNMKSMLKIASIFKDETDYSNNRKKTTSNQPNNISNSPRKEKSSTNNYDYSPTFFITS